MFPDKSPALTPCHPKRSKGEGASPAFQGRTLGLPLSGVCLRLEVPGNTSLEISAWRLVCKIPRIPWLASALEISPQSLPFPGLTRCFGSEIHPATGRSEPRAHCTAVIQRRRCSWVLWSPERAVRTPRLTPDLQRVCLSYPRDLPALQGHWTKLQSSLASFSLRLVPDSLLFSWPHLQSVGSGFVTPRRSAPPLHRLCSENSPQEC